MCYLNTVLSLFAQTITSDLATAPFTQAWALIIIKTNKDCAYTAPKPSRAHAVLANIITAFRMSIMGLCVVCGARRWFMERVWDEIKNNSSLTKILLRDNLETLNMNFDFLNLNMNFEFNMC